MIRRVICEISLKRGRKKGVRAKACSLKTPLQNPAAIASNEVHAGIMYYMR